MVSPSYNPKAGLIQPVFNSMLELLPQLVMSEILDKSGAIEKTNKNLTRELYFQQELKKEPSLIISGGATVIMDRDIYKGG